MAAAGCLAVDPGARPRPHPGRCWWSVVRDTTGAILTGWEVQQASWGYLIERAAHLSGPHPTAGQTGPGIPPGRWGGRECGPGPPCRPKSPALSPPAAPKAQCFLIPGRAGEVTHSDYESELEGGIRPLAGKQRGGTDFTNLTLEYKSLCRV